MGIIERIRASRMFQRAMRVLQFLSSIISLGLFSSRLGKILALGRRASNSNGAVEGILASAVAYNIATLITSLCLKRGASKWLCWLLIIMDLLFVGAFIAVSYLTRPNGGSSGPCKTRKYGVDVKIPKGSNCNLPWGVFVLAIISTILHLLTAIFHEVREKQKAKKNEKNGNGNGNDNGNDNGA